MKQDDFMGFSVDELPGLRQRLIDGDLGATLWAINDKDLTVVGIMQEEDGKVFHVGKVQPAHSPRGHEQSYWHIKLGETPENSRTVKAMLAEIEEIMESKGEIRRAHSWKPLSL